MAAIHSIHRRMIRGLSASVTLLLLLTALSDRACAGGGLFGLDHEWAYDNSGVWKRSNQLDLEYGVIGSATSTRSGMNSGRALIRPPSQSWRRRP
jgi:hypothetical protein